MSPAAIAQRLEEMRGLCELMNYLSRFAPAVKAAEAASKREREGK